MKGKCMKLRLLVFFYLISIVGIKTVCMEVKESTNLNKENEIKAIHIIKKVMHDIISIRNTNFLYTIDGAEKKLLEKQHFSIEDCEYNKINTTTYQTKRGIFLVMPHNHAPWTFWTRWGEYQPFRIQGPRSIGKINVWDDFWKRSDIFNALKKEEIILKNAKYALNNPSTVFRVEKVKKINLCYAEKKNTGSYIKHKKAFNEWKKLYEKYITHKKN